ncbi:MAG: hypothetical protein M3Y82_07840, partial [Verrucomicrobiota bacterium]|nr:hypothetical protein [Verrucomicrobiota bacterium]
FELELCMDNGFFDLSILLVLSRLNLPGLFRESELEIICLLNSSHKWGARPPRAQPTTPSSLAGEGCANPMMESDVPEVQREGALNRSRDGCASRNDL